MSDLSKHQLFFLSRNTALEWFTHHLLLQHLRDAYSDPDWPFLDILCINLTHAAEASTTPESINTMSELLWHQPPPCCTWDWMVWRTPAPSINTLSGPIIRLFYKCAQTYWILVWLLAGSLRLLSRAEVQKRRAVVISPDLIPYPHCPHLNANHLSRGEAKGGQAAPWIEPNECWCFTHRKSRRQQL